MGLKSAYKEAMSKLYGNMLISGNLVVDMVDRISELEKNITDLEEKLRLYQNTNNAASNTEQVIKHLIWYEWTSGRKIPDNIPFGDLLLVEVSQDSNDAPKKFKTAKFIKTICGEVIGVVGDQLWIEREIIRWASIQHLIQI